MSRLLFLALALMLACASFALPSLFSYTGTTAQPTAAVVPVNQMQLAADWVNFDPAAYPLRAVYGLKDGWELGVGYTPQSALDAWNVGSKWQVPFAPFGAQTALGAVYFKINEQDLSVTQLYFVGSKPLIEAGEISPAISANLGVNWTQIDEDGDRDSEVREFASLELAFPNQLTLSGELQTRSSIDSESLWGVKATYPWTPTLTVEAGVVNGFTAGSDNVDFFLGLAYTFGQSAE